MVLEVSPASEVDVDAMVEILSDGVTYKQRHGDNSWGSKLYTKAEVQGLLGTGSAYVARLSNEPVGTLLLQWTDDIIWENYSDAGYVHQLAVKNGFHGQNLGAQILDWASGEVAKRRKKFLRLDCHSDNTKLCNYYENLGFVLVGHKSIPDRGNYIASLYERSVE
jgi:ribosomal protein S18 acetylase RimI-like enzyme